MSVDKQEISENQADLNIPVFINNSPNGVYGTINSILEMLNLKKQVNINSKTKTLEFFWEFNQENIDYKIKFHDYILTSSSSTVRKEQVLPSLNDAKFCIFLFNSEYKQSFNILKDNLKLFKEKYPNSCPILIIDINTNPNKSNVPDTEIISFISKSKLDSLINFIKLNPQKNGNKLLLNDDILEKDLLLSEDILIKKGSFIKKDSLIHEDATPLKEDYAVLSDMELKKGSLLKLKQDSMLKEGSLINQGPVTDYFKQLITQSKGVQMEVKSENSLLSDHLPILTNVPMGEEDIKIVSWNIMGVGAANDLGIKDDLKYPTERYKKIVEFLEKNNPDIILLQEVSNYYLEAVLKEWPSMKDWVVINDHQMVSLVRKDKFKNANAIEHQLDNKRTQSFRLETNIGNIIHIDNAWTPYDYNPTAHQKYYQELLSRRNEDKAVIDKTFKGKVVYFLGGDTNSRVCPLDGKLHATGVVPTSFKVLDYARYDAMFEEKNLANNETVKIGDHPDGAFICDDNGIRQAEFTPLMTEKEFIGNDNEFYKDHAKIYRPILTLDPFFEAKKKEEPYKSFFEAVSFIKDSKQSDLLFDGLLTVNSEGKFGVMLTIKEDSNLNQLVKGKFSSHGSFIFIDKLESYDSENNVEYYNGCSVDADNIKLLSDLLTSVYLKTKALDKLDSQITTLQQKRVFFWNSKDKVERLEVLKNEISKIDPTKCDDMSKAIRTVILGWKEAKTFDEKLKVGNKTNWDYIQKQRNFFHVNLGKTSTEEVIEDIEKIVKPK